MEIRIEEALKLLWLKEESWSEEEFQPVIKYKIEEKDYEELMKLGLVRRENGKWGFTERGKHAASDIIRRLRLAEWLFHELVEVNNNYSSEAACRLEHILNEEIADRICSLFGHPRFCPHGKPIPRGKCCGEKKFNTIKPIHLPLTYVEEGEFVKVISIDTDDRRILHKLVSLGLMPGVILKVLKKRPLFMIELDESVISVDRDIAEKIFVKILKERI
ncbi:MAG: metal-dependent transcriptional regulator [candidate division WOR-3 bacterium]